MSKLTTITTEINGIIVIDDYAELMTVNYCYRSMRAVTPYEVARPSPKWLTDYAADYAARNGLKTIRASEYAATDEYRRCADGNLRAANRIAAADIAAIGGEPIGAEPIDRTPYQKGDAE